MMIVVLFLFFLVCWQTFSIFYHLLCHRHEGVWSYVKTFWWSVKLTAEIWWRNERIVKKESQEFFFPFFCYLLTHSSFGGFRWQMAWMHIENRCNISVTQVLLIWANHLKLKNNNTAPSTKQLEDCIYTHKPMKKGILQLFFFLLSLKRAIKYIKTYLQCVVFGQKTTNNKTKRYDRLFSSFAGI